MRFFSWRPQQFDHPAQSSERELYHHSKYCFKFMFWASHRSAWCRFYWLKKRSSETSYSQLRNLSSRCTISVLTKIKTSTISCSHCSIRQLLIPNVNTFYRPFWQNDRKKILPDSNDHVHNTTIASSDSFALQTIQRGRTILFIKIAPASLLYQEESDYLMINPFSRNFRNHEQTFMSWQNCLVYISWNNESADNWILDPLAKRTLNFNDWNLLLSFPTNITISD